MSAVIVDHLWQSTLFVVVAWLLTLVLRNNAARFRYWVWFAASIKFLIPFALLTALGNQFSWQSSPSSTSERTLGAIVQQISEQMSGPLATPQIVLRAPQAESFDFLRIVLVIWVLGCALLLMRWGVSWLRIKAAVRKAEPVSIQAPIVVKSTSVMSEPGVVGVVRPVLLLPEGISTRLSTQQMQAILAHELCHVRRRDNLTAAIHMLVEALFWFHPLVWWIGARLIEERERACDEGVVELGNEPQSYAEAILKVCQFYLESKLTCVAGVSGANLKHRVEVIMKNRNVASLNAAKKILLTSVASMSIVVPLTIGLVSSPTAAQAATDTKQAFDEISIARRPPPTPGSNAGVWSLMKDGNYSARNQPLRGIIAFAYGVEKTRVTGGPQWLDSQGYDIEAKAKGHVDGEMPEHLDSYRLMMRTLLQDRFHVIVHKELQPVSVFVMTVADQGATFTTSKPPEGIPNWVKLESRALADKGGISFQSSTMQSVSWTFSSMLARPVLDQTKIDGKYTFRLDLPAVPGKSRAEALPAEVEKQLGLKLEPQTASLDVVVIDGIQQPTEDDVINASTIQPALRK